MALGLAEIGVGLGQSTQMMRRCSNVGQILRRGDRGAAIIEFALLVFPLFFIVFATIEIGIIFIANVNLSNAVLAITRQVRLGLISLPGMAVTATSGTQMSLPTFKTTICKSMVMMTTSACNIQLQVDVRVLSDFSAAPPEPVSGTSFSTASFCFYSGLPGNVVSIRAYLLWPVVTPVLLSSLAGVTSVSSSSGTSSGNFFVLKADEAFVNEPSSSVTNTGQGC